MGCVFLVHGNCGGEHGFDCLHNAVFIKWLSHGYKHVHYSDIPIFPVNNFLVNNEHIKILL